MFEFCGYKYCSSCGVSYDVQTVQQDEKHNLPSNNPISLILNSALRVIPHSYSSIIDDGDSGFRLHHHQLSVVISHHRTYDSPHPFLLQVRHTLPAHITTTSLAANHVEKKCPLSTCRRRRQDVAIIVSYERMFVPNTINPMS
jgi:hypothetical protein